MDVSAYTYLACMIFHVTIIKPQNAIKIAHQMYIFNATYSVIFFIFFSLNVNNSINYIVFGCCAAAAGAVCGMYKHLNSGVRIVISIIILAYLTVKCQEQVWTI